MPPRRILFTVTNDLNTDQRMHRICQSLSAKGWEVELVGRKDEKSLPLEDRVYKQTRIPCQARKGKLFYLEFNWKLYRYLQKSTTDVICAIDLDTILPVYRVSKQKNIPRVMDAHEWFSEMKEVVRRPLIRASWKKLEQSLLPQFPLGYTVCDSIAEEFRKRYGIQYEVIRNVPWLSIVEPTLEKENFILYQGSVNEARGLEFLVPAMKNVDSKLIIVGSGNLEEKIRGMISQMGLENKIEMKGRMDPESLKCLTNKAMIGINLLEPIGQNNVLSLANKFFDYIHAGVPQLTMEFPEYAKIMEQWQVGYMIKELSSEMIAESLNKMKSNRVLYGKMQMQCLAARNELNWQKEETKLLQWYQNHFH